MIVNDELYSSDATDDEIDEDPAQDAGEPLANPLTEREARRRIKKLVERWRGRGTPVARAYAYELEKTFE